MDVTVIDNPAQHRYEIRAGEKIAGFTEYQPVAGDRVVFFHTRVDGSFQGKGMGSRLVRERWMMCGPAGCGCVRSAPMSRRGSSGTRTTLTWLIGLDRAGRRAE